MMLIIFIVGVIGFVMIVDAFTVSISNIYLSLLSVIPFLILLYTVNIVSSKKKKKKQMQEFEIKYLGSIPCGYGIYKCSLLCLKRFGTGISLQIITKLNGT